MSKHIAFHAYETRTARERHRQCALVRAGQYLDAQRHRRGGPHGAADDRERRNDLRANRTSQIRPIVRVFDHDAVEAGCLVNTRFDNRRAHDVVERLIA